MKLIRRKKTKGLREMAEKRVAGEGEVFRLLVRKKNHRGRGNVPARADN